MSALAGAVLIVGTYALLGAYPDFEEGVRGVALGVAVGLGFLLVLKSLIGSDDR